MSVNFSISNFCRSLWDRSVDTSVEEIEMQDVRDFHKPMCLQEQFAAQAFEDVDVHFDCGFINYLEPNEGNPQRMIPHLKLIMEKGIAVCTGAERLLFLLALSDEGVCEGVIGRDINPKVKAYLDFAILLLRISVSREQFVQLSTPVVRVEGGVQISMPIEEEKDFKERLSVIKRMLLSSNIPNDAKQYYLKHLEDFGSVYLYQPQLWRKESCFSECNYLKNDQQFLKLQRYAKSGNIVPTIGDINKLKFLEGRNVNIVDTSNVSSYVVLNFLGGVGFNPRIVRTKVDENAIYSSYVHSPMNEKEHAEFDSLIKKLQSCTRAPIDAGWLIRNLPSDDAAEGPVRSRETLLLLRNYVERNVFEISESLGIDMNNHLSIERLNDMPRDVIENMHKINGVDRFVHVLVRSWYQLDPSIYFAFRSVEGWTEAFNEYSESHRDNPYFLEKMKAEGERLGFKF